MKMRFEEKIGALLLAVAVFFHVFARGVLPNDAFFLAANILNVTFSFFAVYYTLAAFVVSQYDEASRHFWLFMHMGLLVWFLGDVAWLVQEIFLNLPVPFPSFSDIFWVLGYPLLIFALLHWFRNFVLGETRLSQFNVIAMVGAAMVASILVFGAPGLFSMSVGGLGNTLNSLYIAGDFLLFLIAISVALILAQEARQFGYKETRGYWMFLAFAFAALSIFDILFGFLVGRGSYYTGHAIDFLYYAGYLTLGMAAVYFRYSTTQSSIWVLPKQRKR